MRWFRKFSGRASNPGPGTGRLEGSMASWIHTRLWVLVGILLAFGCQRYDDQPDANPVPAPALGDITIQLNDSGKGDLPTPLVKDLRDGALTLQLSKPRHGEIVADLLAGRVIYTAHDDFRGTDTANYTLKRGSSTTSGRVLVQVAERSCLTIARDDEFTLQVPFQRDYPLEVKANDVLCPGTRLLAVLNGQTFFRVDDEGQMIFNTPPGFNGTASGEYELESQTGYRSRAHITVHVTACTTPLVAHVDYLNYPRQLLLQEDIRILDLIRNDQACSDSIDTASIQVQLPGGVDTQFYNVRVDRTTLVTRDPVLKLMILSQDSTRNDYYFDYTISTKRRRQTSQARVYIHLQ